MNKYFLITLITSIVLLVIAILMGFLFFTRNPKDIASWHNATPYPFPISYEEVVSSGNYIYVLGAGLISNGSHTNKTYYALLMQNGIGNWIRTTDTPTTPIIQNSCVAYDSKSYCIGVDNDFSYYANLSSNGVGNWTRTTAYPINITDGTQCVNQKDLMCCIGGIAEITGNMLSSAYCSHIGASGIGAWNRTTGYPIPIAKERLVVYDGYVYGVGGMISNDNYHNTDASYYAKLTANGIGGWNKTTSYPYSVRSQGMVAYDGYVYGIGGAHAEGIKYFTLNQVYFASLSSNGIGSWIESSQPYPLPMFHMDCALLNATVYCVGGIQTNVNEPHANAYYANLTLKAKP